MSQINVDTIKKADGTGSLSVPAESGTVVVKDGSNDVTLNNITATGVYLGGTGAANYLDDYEEGTWTPALEASTTNPTPTSVTVNSATYTKIGNTVSIRAYIAVNLTNSGVGGARITGLPFTANNFSPVLFTHGDLIQSTGGYVNNGSTSITAIQTNSVNSQGFNTSVLATRYLMIMATYKTDS